MSKKILIIEDEIKLVEIVTKYLESEMFTVISSTDGKHGLDKALQEKPNLILLDLMLPGLSGFDVCREIRKKLKTPIIMITAKSQEVDKLVGLELGADDYITKPFSLAELTARIRAVLRRTEGTDLEKANIIEAGKMTLDLDKHEFFVNNELVPLTPTELNILSVLMRNSGRVFSRLQLLEMAMNDAYEGYERSIDTHVRNIRKKIEIDPAVSQCITTVHGVGYKFKEK